MKKIIIFGFPHCGTSILRSIFSHIPSVYEYPIEAKHVTNEMIKEAQRLGKEHVVIKYPFVVNYKSKMYDQYIKIFILRSPFYVFSSLNKRCRYLIPPNHSFRRYEGTAVRFLESQPQNIPDMYHIRYEDIFEDDFRELGRILDSIGLDHTSDIYNNDLFSNVNERRDMRDIKNKTRKFQS